ncbi:hypothetical protein NZK35_05740 [Stieleria sp. ICT_E10.1]|uniref:hypothetical protein n=1 Tax=Stieleria sedimenti TaxID=2976331 RepID=UPI00217F3A5B|nr:hypothetical protein [Stieleria sedimenti]MCS7466175.1 hypothetical protein [Stieleria sedimenti]
MTENADKKISKKPEVVEKAARRRFTEEYKRRIAIEAEACTQPGEIGALLRREGLYSSRVKVNIADVDFSAVDDFDSGVPDGGTGPWASDWNLTSNSAFTSSNNPNDGNLHAIVQRRGVLTRQLDTTGVSNLNLSFASKLRSFENNDNAYVRVSPMGPIGRR